MPGFSRATFDIALGDREMQIFVSKSIISLEDLLERLGVLVGTGGGAITFPRGRPSVMDRYPTNLLVEMSSKQPVGMVHADFEHAGQFGLCTDRQDLLDIASQFAAAFGDPITYATSYKLY